MTVAKRAFQGLAPWRPVVAAQEVVSHIALAWFSIASGIGYLGVMAVFAAELAFGNLVSVAMYPERGARRHAWDLVKFVLAFGFLLIFVVATYAVASQGGNATNTLDLRAALPADPDHVLRWSIAFAALSLGVRYALARRDPDPKFAWARSVLVQNAATFVTLLFMIFVAAFAGAFLGMLLRPTGIDMPVDAALIAVTAGMRLFFALLVSRMPDSEMRDIAHRPYID